MRVKENRKIRAVVADFLCVLLFVAIGRHAHKHGITFGGMVSTMWPFFAGLLCGWLLLTWKHMRFERVSSGYVVVVSTVFVGMILRVIASQGTAFSFICVALIFLSLFLLGWRLAVKAISKGK